MRESSVDIRRIGHFQLINQKSDLNHFLRSSESCELTAPGPSQSLYTGLSSRSHSLASRSRSVHSLLNIEIPPPPKSSQTDKSKGSKHQRCDPPAPTVSIYDSGESLHRSQSHDRLDRLEAVSLSYSGFRPRPLMPPLADMRSVSAEHQHEPAQRQSNLYRTISRATLVDQDTGNVYQV